MANPNKIRGEEQNARSMEPTPDAAGETNPMKTSYYSANLILLAVSSFFPSTSLTVPVAVTFLASLQMLS